MPNYIVQGSDLSSVASAIRTKAGTSDQLAFPAGFVSAIDALPSGGGIEKAEGDFTIVSESNNNAPTLTHNLGSQKIAVLIYPKSKISASAGYHNFYAAVINVPEICSGQTWTFDWTSYNTHFTEDEVVTLPADNLRYGVVHVSPYLTQTNWYSGGNPAVIASGIQGSNNRVVFTDNTVCVRGAGGNLTWATGSYHWIAWKLG